MFWADRTNRIAGLLLLLLAALVVVNIVLATAATGDADPAAREDVEGLLADINDNEALYYLGVASSIAVDAAVLLAVAAALYLVFRDRSRLLALVGFSGFFAGSVAYLAADSANLALGFLAADFASEGGAGGIAAGDAVILQAARAVGAFAGLADVVANTALALGLGSVGLLVTGAPRGRVNPPPWLGWLGVIAGLCLVLGWTTVIAEVLGIVFFGIGYVGILLWLVVLGAWLLRQPEAVEAA